jgi:hypothetical protein
MQPKPDYRNTLFWDPQIRTDVNGNTTVDFYTSDENALFTIMVTGISGKGQTGSFTGTLSVEDK